jgi:hypothetical protein
MTPDHPDYARLTAVLDSMDAGGDVTDPDDPYYLGVLHSAIDERSIAVLAEKRVRTALQANRARIASDPLVFLMSLYVDAFVLGVRFQQAGGHSD